MRGCESGEYLDEINRIATIQSTPLSRRTIRRRRLHRLADLLNAHTGRIQLLTRIEHFPPAERRAIRCELSPLALAYGDAQFRLDGLAGDTLGDAIKFFELTDRQAHRLFLRLSLPLPGLDLGDCRAPSDDGEPLEPRGTLAAHTRSLHLVEISKTLTDGESTYRTSSGDWSLGCRGRTDPIGHPRRSTPST